MFSKFSFENLTPKIILTLSPIKIRKPLAATLQHSSLDPKPSLNVSQSPCGCGMIIYSDMYLRIS